MNNQQQPHLYAAELPLSVPGSSNTSFTSLFNVPTMDLIDGNYAALLQPFEHNLTNVTNNTTTQAIKTRRTQLEVQHCLIAAIVIAGG